MEQRQDSSAHRRPTPPTEPRRRTSAEDAMRDFKQQLGLDESAWRAMLMSVREPSWDERREGRG